MADTEARYYKKEPVNKTRCVLCPHRCFLSNNKSGICKVRYNKDGTLMTRIYGEISSYAMDPIEKKPLYHFYPGTQIFSIGSWGCNFRCTFCQNWQISQQEVPTEHFEKEDVVEIAIHNNSVGIAYTYNEPFMGYEFVYDTARLAREKGLKNVMVTNGFISEEPLKEILPYIDAMNIDIKAGSESFYREVCGGQMEPVLKTIKTAFDAGCHVELTNLLIPTLNDGEDVDRVIDYTASVSTDIPLHFSRYFPQYKMNLDPTGLDLLKSAYEKGRKKLKYVYLGNVPDDAGGSNTICPKCSKEVIKREWLKADLSAMNNSNCRHCGTAIYGKF